VRAFAQGKWGETFSGKPPGKTRPDPVDDRRRRESFGTPNPASRGKMGKESRLVSG